MKPFLILLLLINPYFTHLSYSLTFKSDGTVIQSDGTYLKEPPFLQYQKTLNSYLNGEPLPEDWPVVEIDSNGNPKKVKGYFGEKILEEGAPLFSIPQSLGGDVMESLALQNGLLKDQLGAVLVSNSKSEWRQESEIEEEIYNQSKQYSTYLAKSDYMGFKLQEVTKTFLVYENLKKESQQFLLLNPDDDIAVIEYRRELDSKVADISNKLNNYFQFGKEESKNLLNELSGKFRELTKNYDNEEMIDILQLEMKNNIELSTDLYIDDLNYSQEKVDLIIQNKTNENMDDPNLISSLVLIEDISRKSKIIDLSKNIESYKQSFEKLGVDRSNMLSEDWINAVKSWEEYPGAVFQKFNTIASLQEDFEDFNEISEEFKKSVENSIKLMDPFGEGSLERGLLSMRYNELQNQIGNLDRYWEESSNSVGPVQKWFYNDPEHYNSLQSELKQVEEELGYDFQRTLSFGEAYFNDCDCVRDVTQEDMDKMDPETGRFEGN
jgi:hypothetical protein